MICRAFCVRYYSRSFINKLYFGGKSCPVLTKQPALFYSFRILIREECRLFSSAVLQRGGQLAAMDRQLRCIHGFLLIFQILRMWRRSEEHTSELSHVAISYAVFCLKKKS